MTSGTATTAGAAGLDVMTMTERHPQFGKFVPGSIWTNGPRRFIVRGDGRWLSYPGMGLLLMEPRLDNLTRVQVGD